MCILCFQFQKWLDVSLYFIGVDIFVLSILNVIAPDIAVFNGVA